MAAGVSPLAASDVLVQGRQEHILVRRLDPTAQANEFRRGERLQRPKKRPDVATFNTVAG